MNLELSPSSLSGSLTIHASKSLCHRAIIAASLSQGVSKLSNFYLSDDTEATLQAVHDLGWADYQLEANRLTITGGLNRPAKTSINCRESATTLRLLIPIALVKNKSAVFTGTGRLLSRSMEPYKKLFTEQGISYQNDGQSISVAGSFTNPNLIIDGDVSSQFISGLLMAMPLLPQPSTLICSEEPASENYIRLTMGQLNHSAIAVTREAHCWQVAPQVYRPFNTILEGDYSNGAWFLAANSLGAAISLKGLPAVTEQADAAIVPLLQKIVQPGPLTFDGNNCIDLIPLLAVLCCLRQGETTITNIGRLRDKESDRLSSIVHNLRLLGAAIKEYPTAVSMQGQPFFQGNVTVESFNDHRMAMAMALAALRCHQSIILKDSQCVKKSYPDFWQDYRRLGGLIHEL